MPIRKKRPLSRRDRRPRQGPDLRLIALIEGIAMAAEERRASSLAANAIGFTLMVRCRRGFHQIRPQAAARRSRTDCSDRVRAATALPSGFRRAWNRPGADRVVAMGYRRLSRLRWSACARLPTRCFCRPRRSIRRRSWSRRRSGFSRPRCLMTPSRPASRGSISSARWAGRHRLIWRCARDGRWSNRSRKRSSIHRVRLKRTSLTS